MLGAFRALRIHQATSRALAARRDARDVGRTRARSRFAPHLGDRFVPLLVSATVAARPQHRRDLGPVDDVLRRRFQPHSRSTTRRVGRRQQRGHRRYPRLALPSGLPAIDVRRGDSFRGFATVCALSRRGLSSAVHEPDDGSALAIAHRPSHSRAPIRLKRGPFRALGSGGST